MLTPLKRNDLILIFSLTILSLMPLLFNIESNKNIAEVKINNKVFRQVDLSKDDIFMIDTEDGKNVVKVEGGKIAIIEADCPDKICVKTGAISKVGAVIACVPHNILILIKHAV